jgi:hypothetical protein
MLTEKNRGAPPCGQIFKIINSSILYMKEGWKIKKLGEVAEESEEYG